MPTFRADPFASSEVRAKSRTQSRRVLDRRISASLDAARTKRGAVASVAVALLLLSACGTEPSDPFGASDADRIECRIGAATAFDRACIVERTIGADGLVLTIRHPDGGFRRLLVTKDGRGVVAADGAEPATVSVEGGDGIVVAVGGDNYRLPATVKSAGQN